ncbi:hypothetical protein LCGC14_0393150 [marine sediment metagenome]|uniref:Uncharacterized protein n=1 Tax=marine sediment metagenome TaxID=412755 RepID=A0A0F9T4X2_9ZZZZ
MELIYNETDNKPGSQHPDRPCVAVKVYAPTSGEDVMIPTIIILGSGKVTAEGRSDYTYRKIILAEDMDRPATIRKAIRLFDAFKRKVYSEQGGE